MKVCRWALGGSVVCWLLLLQSLGATELVLRDGRVLRGRVVQLPSLVLDKPISPDASRPVTLVDDQLRRTFIPRRLVEQVRPSPGGTPVERFHIDQPGRRGGYPVIAAGAPLRVTPFDEWGRRIFTMKMNKGPVDIIQGITLITPQYIKVEALRRFKWEMYISTSSVPRATLNRILHRYTDPKNVEHRLKIARLYLQAQRYEDARRELEEIIQDFPERKDQLEPILRELRALAARRLLAEVELRRLAGQHRLALAILRSFPSDGVPGEVLQQVQSELGQYKKLYQRGQTLAKALQELLKQLPPPTAEKVKPWVQEILQELSIFTLDRLGAFEVLGQGEDLPAEDRMALALSGWLLGRDGAVTNLPVALSLFEVRRLIQEYFQAPTLIERRQVLGKILAQEGATPQRVALLLAHMKPPVETPPGEKPGFYRLLAPGVLDAPPVPYLVQLPPEYNPYHRYPAIITLHAAYTTPEKQVDWWAGAWDKKGQTRLGQAARHGYIVIAPRWAKKHQAQYRYSLEEHQAVLNVFRDAARRFSIDMDRVFITGHSMGGDAAWDLAVSHPDLWAGAIIIGGKADRYVKVYWRNARHVPLYFVLGELDLRTREANVTTWDRYLQSSYGYPVTVVEFQGRGHESFVDEQLRLFDWMQRQRREPFLRNFECVTMRPWDNFFWWVELEELPAKSMVDPAFWPPRRGTRPFRVQASVRNNNLLRVQGRSGRVILWLSPQLVQFDRTIQIYINSRRLRFRPEELQPQVEVILEDARTRGDRQHPFWAKVVFPK